MTLTMPMTVPDYVAEWFGQLQTRPLAEAVPDPTAAAVFSADMVVGFCAHGNSAEVKAFYRLISPDLIFLIEVPGDATAGRAASVHQAALTQQTDARGHLALCQASSGIRSCGAPSGLWIRFTQGRLMTDVGRQFEQTMALIRAPWWRRLLHQPIHTIVASTALRLRPLVPFTLLVHARYAFTCSRREILACP